MENCFKIFDPAFGRQIQAAFPDQGGVYKLIALEHGKPAIIRRCLDDDPNGVLYIGKAISYSDRVIGLKKSISPGYSGQSHICGRRYKGKNHEHFRQKFPVEILHVLLLPTDHPEKAERQALDEYIQRFGEVPPLNAF